MKNVRNFFRHASHVGFFAALVELVIFFLAGDRLYYMDDGCLYSEGPL